jgi:hypothetical protein
MGCAPVFSGHLKFYNLIVACGAISYLGISPTMAALCSIHGWNFYGPLLQDQTTVREHQNSCSIGAGPGLHGLGRFRHFKRNVAGH